jgi:hypothetical protein
MIASADIHDSISLLLVFIAETRCILCEKSEGKDTFRNLNITIENVRFCITPFTRYRLQSIVNLLIRYGDIFAVRYAYNVKGAIRTCSLTVFFYKLLTSTKSMANNIAQSPQALRFAQIS